MRSGQCPRRYAGHLAGFLTRWLVGPCSELDRDVAEAVEGDACSGWEDAGPVVFLYDEGTSARRREITAAHNRRLAPASLGAEVGQAGRQRRTGVGSRELERPRRQRALGDPLAGQPDLGQLDRLLGAGAVAIGALVLLAEGILERSDRSRVERPVSDRQGQIEALALVVQARRAQDADPVGRKAFGR